MRIVISNIIKISQADESLLQRVSREFKDSRVITATNSINNEREVLLNDLYKRTHVAKN